MSYNIDTRYVVQITTQGGEKPRTTRRRGKGGGKTRHNDTYKRCLRQARYGEDLFLPGACHEAHRN